MNCYNCKSYNDCMNTFRDSKNIHCPLYIANSDICDYCDKEVEVSHQVVLTYGPFHKGKHLFVCTKCKDSLVMGGSAGEVL